MSILYCHPYNDFTGSTRVLSEIIEESQSTEQVRVITTNKENGFLSNIENIKIINTPKWGFRSRSKIKKILNLFITGLNHTLLFLKVLYSIKSSDIIYINTILPFGAALAARIRRRPIVYHIHEKIRLRWYMIYVKFAEYVFNHVKADRIFVSEYTKSCYPRNKKGTEKVIYNKMPKEFRNNSRIKNTDERDFNNILLVSSLSRFKGIFKYIELAKKMPEYNFTMVLSSDINSITEYIGSDLPNNLRVFSSQCDLSKFYYDADLLLNLSNPRYCIETFGMTLIEAMSFGVPAVAPNIGGPTEIIDDNIDGRLIDVTSTEQITTSIKEILGNKQKYKAMSEKALEKASKFC